MTYMGKPYYPAWLDNLADDVTGEGAAWDGTIQGAAAVHEAVVAAREIYEFQDFHYAGPCGENSFLEDYTSSVRGVPLYVIVLVTFNAARHPWGSSFARTMTRSRRAAPTRSPVTSWTR